MKDGTGGFAMKSHFKESCLAAFFFTGSLVSQVTIEDFNWYQDDASLQYAWKATQEAVGPYLEKTLVKSGNAMRLSLQFSGTNPGTSIEGKVYERTVARVDRIYKNGIDLSGCGEIVLSLYVPDKEIIDNLVIRLYSPAGNRSGTHYFWTWRDIQKHPDIENGWKEIRFPKNSFSK